MFVPQGSSGPHISCFCWYSSQPMQETDAPVSTTPSMCTLLSHTELYNVWPDLLGLVSPLLSSGKCTGLLLLRERISPFRKYPCRSRVLWSLVVHGRTDILPRTSPWFYEALWKWFLDIFIWIQAESWLFRFVLLVSYRKKKASFFFKYFR